MSARGARKSIAVKFPEWTRGGLEDEQDLLATYLPGMRTVDEGRYRKFDNE